MRLLNDPQRDILAAIDSAHRAEKEVRWLGAVSFEERCIASAITLSEMGALIDRVTALRYSTKVLQSWEDKRRRRDNEERLRSALPNGFETVDANAYALLEIGRIFRNELLNQSLGLLIIDTTCLTKIHTMAIASFLSRCANEVRWIAAYTLPEAYGDSESEGRHAEWSDVLIAPVAETATMLFESHSRGILVLGHEPSRLHVALSELEPVGGTIIVGNTIGRPEFRHVCETVNRQVVRRLTKLRAGNWRQRAVGVYDFAQVELLVRREIADAEKYQAPIILYPFGPKPFVFQISYLMSQCYAKSSWYIYPVPRAYDINYSDGISETRWFDLGTHVN